MKHKFIVSLLLGLIALNVFAAAPVYPPRPPGGITYDATFTNIVQSLAGGGVVSNAVALTFEVDTWYTNSTAYWADPRVQIGLNTDTGTVVEMQVRTNLADLTEDYMRRLVVNSAAITVSGDLLVPPGAAWRWAVTLGAAAVDDTSPNGSEVIYWGSGGTGGAAVDTSTLVLRTGGVATNLGLYGTTTATTINATTVTGNGSGLTNVNAVTATNLYGNTLVRNAYYVDGSFGSDTNDGSSGAPWETIQHAQENAVEGATIYVTSGLYPEQIWRSGVLFYLARNCEVNSSGVGPTIIITNNANIRIAGEGGLNAGGSSDAFLRTYPDDFSTYYAPTVEIEARWIRGSFFIHFNGGTGTPFVRIIRAHVNGRIEENFDITAGDAGYYSFEQVTWTDWPAETDFPVSFIANQARASGSIGQGVGSVVVNTNIPVVLP
jgi:hypothetical protein